ncbi:MAG: hypothetical protein FD141_31 [Fusobacteria bacterium]|nr:MAG: hypothetical protein FD141_31 [Fusobacteriota bacterium]KAF0229305.1 MAG: hypothetical protein FD182_1561 [Fusobacteriota bacterium]
MEKEIDLKKSVYELVKTYPEIKTTLVELGFKDIVLPGMLETAGRIMTIEKGAKMKQFDIKDIIKKLEDKGYKVV